MEYSSQFQKFSTAIKAKNADEPVANELSELVGRGEATDVETAEVGTKVPVGVGLVVVIVFLHSPLYCILTCWAFSSHSFE
jgi:hypothetical protein